MSANIVSIFNVFIIRNFIENSMGLPRLGQLISFLIVLSCIVIPIISKPLLKVRLSFICLSLLNVYFHLSISYESIFIVFLCFQMISWLLVESFKYCDEFNIDLALNKKRTHSFHADDDEEFMHFNWPNVFRVFLLIFHLLIAFFGTGNMASINSFDPVSVYCFITVFSPFLMGFLLFLKVVIPFLIVVVVFYCIFDVIDLSIRTSFTLLMVMSDLMALHFFFEIKTEGSWLDIGTSISHYIIVMLMIIIVSIIFSVAQFLFKFNLLDISFMRPFKKRIQTFD